MDYMELNYFTDRIGDVVSAIGLSSAFVSAFLYGLIRLFAAPTAILYMVFSAIQFRNSRISFDEYLLKAAFLLFVLGLLFGWINIVRYLWDWFLSFSENLAGAAVATNNFTPTGMFDTIFGLMDAIKIEWAFFDGTDNGQSECGWNPFCHIAALWDSATATFGSIMAQIVFSIVSLCFAVLIELIIMGVYFYLVITFAIFSPLGMVFLPMVLLRQTKPFFNKWLGLFLTPLFSLPLVMLTIVFFVITLAAFVGIPPLAVFTFPPGQIPEVTLSFTSLGQMVPLLTFFFIFGFLIYKSVSFGAQLANSQGVGLSGGAIGAIS